MSHSRSLSSSETKFLWPLASWFFYLTTTAYIEAVIKICIFIQPQLLRISNSLLSYALLSSFLLLSGKCVCSTLVPLFSLGFLYFAPLFFLRGKRSLTFILFQSSVFIFSPIPVHNGNGKWLMIKWFSFMFALLGGIQWIQNCWICREIVGKRVWQYYTKALRSWFRKSSIEQQDSKGTWHLEL